MFITTLSLNLIEFLLHDQTVNCGIFCYNLVDYVILNLKAFFFRLKSCKSEKPGFDLLIKTFFLGLTFVRIFTSIFFFISKEFVGMNE